MDISGNTILITGGTSGLGFEMAKQLLDLNNTVIITGRDEAKLNFVKKQFPNVHIIQSDASDIHSIFLLYETIKSEFPALNIVINNAGIMYKTNFNDDELTVKEVSEEINTNLIGTIGVTKQFIPLLKKQSIAAIVNVSSGLAFSPLAVSPVYCATKAAIHSFTQSLRVQLANTSIKVYELAPPALKTDSVHNLFDKNEIKNLQLMDLKVLVKQFIAGLKHEKLEIYPGQSKLLVTPQLLWHGYRQSRIENGLNGIHNIPSLFSGSADKAANTSKLLCAA